MTVSVVVPTRNRSALLAVTVRSALAQRDVDFEVIIVDEASTDDTLGVIAGLGDSRVRVIRHERPLGVSAARNRGLAAATGEWIAFLDDDDLWAPNKLALQLQTARQSGATWVYAGHVNINMGYQVTGGAPPLSPERLMAELPQHNVVPGGCSGVMVSRHALGLAGPFDLQLQVLADWDLWLRLARTGTPAYVPHPLVAYRLHGQQMSLDVPRAEAEFRIVAERNAQANPAILYRYLGWWALRVKNHRDALRCFVRAWAQRRPSCTTRVLVSDLASLGRDVIEHHFKIRFPPAKAAYDHELWRRQGQAWVDALIERRQVAGFSTGELK